MYEFKTNDLIESVLYNKHKISSYIKYRKLLYKIKKISPDYNTLEVIYEFIDQLNFAYFYCLDDDNKLFIANSRKDKKKAAEKSLIYKTKNTTILIKLQPDDMITIDIERYMGYKKTIINFKNGEAGDFITNKLEEQLFINCIDLFMDELCKIIKKYRKFRRIK